MASKRRIRRKSCTNKRRHATQGDAKRAVAVMIRTKPDGRRIVAYSCGFCGGWHIGHNGVPL
jgi:hypothetical protein